MTACSINSGVLALVALHRMRNCFRCTITLVCLSNHRADARRATFEPFMSLSISKTGALGRRQSCDGTCSDCPSAHEPQLEITRSEEKQRCGPKRHSNAQLRRPVAALSYSAGVCRGLHNSTLEFNKRLLADSSSCQRFLLSNCRCPPREIVDNHERNRQVMLPVRRSMSAERC